MCDKISITFDPFAMVSLPIPSQKRKHLDFFYIHADNKAKPFRFKIEFNVEKDTMAQIKSILAAKLRKSILVNFLTLSYTEAGPVMDLSVMADSVRKKIKNKNLFAIEYLEEPSRPAELVMQMNQYQEQLYQKISYRPQQKKSFTFARLLKLDTSLSLQQVHLEIFRFNRFFFEEYGYLALSPEDCARLDD